MLSTVMNDSKKVIIKHIIGTLIFLLLLSLGAAGIYNVFKWKDTSGDYFSSMEQMYDLPDNSVDVVFFGPSVMYSGINPAIFWEEKGIPCFNAAIAGQDKEAAYYFIKEFVKKQSPKVVVLAGMLFQIDHYEVQGNVYRNTISMRNSKNFVDAVNAIVPDNDKTESNTVWDYYLRWPIIHSRYKEIQKGDFKEVKEYSKSLGFVYLDESYGWEANPVYFDGETSNPISPENKEWVDRLVKLSKEEGFVLLFVQLPGFLGDSQRYDMNGNFRYLDKIGVKYVDLNLHAEEMGFDYIYDMNDGHHARVSGAEKNSKFLCDFMSENFNLSDRRGEAGYELFEEALEVCRHERLSRKFAECDDLAQIFELIGDGDNIIYSVTLKNGYRGIDDMNAGIIREYMPVRDLGYSGGTSVFRNGLMTEVLSDKTLAFKLNDSDYFSVKPVVTEDGHLDLVDYGSERFQGEEGNFLVIYDTVLDRVVLVRDIM